MNIRYFDMFAGIGGFRSGLTKAGGFTCIGYCENDKYAKKAYEAIYDTEGENFYEDARNDTAGKPAGFRPSLRRIPLSGFFNCWKTGRISRQQRDPIF